MEIRKTNRGFCSLIHPDYRFGEPKVLVGESSAIGAYEDAFENAGSSFLWIGDHHLDREEVTELITHLNNWLKNKRLNHENETSEDVE